MQRAFSEAGDRLFFGGSIEIGRPTKRARGGGSSSSPVRRPPSRKAILDKLQGIAKRSPEVMLKVSSAGRSGSRIVANLKYISRRGQIELEDQDGRVYAGKHAVADVFDSWQDEHPIPMQEAVVVAGSGDASAEEVSRRGGRRESLQIVLSMPVGTPHVELQRAVREFAGDAFGGHQFAMAFHTFDTDPDPNPSPHPHVHLTVKAVSRSGKRLNPRKADLQVWREAFAKRLRDNGVDAVATSRVVRGQRNPGVSPANVQMRLRGAQRDRSVRRISESDAIARNRISASSALRDWGVVLDGLARSSEASERQLGADLSARLGITPWPDEGRGGPSSPAPDTGPQQRGEDSRPADPDIDRGSR
ncbi:MAG: hypothetical protein AB7P21_30205 [Lautropia sp.]